MCTLELLKPDMAVTEAVPRLQIALWKKKKKKFISLQDSKIHNRF